MSPPLRRRRESSFLVRVGLDLRLVSAEAPDVPLGIEGGVAARAVLLVAKRDYDLGSGGDRSLVVGIRVRDNQVEPDGMPLIGLPGQLSLPLRSTHHDGALEGQLHVLDLPVLALVDRKLVGPE